jgi:surface protein
MILATHGIVGSQIVQIVPVFEFSVKTDNSGVSTSTEFRMPLTTSTGLDMNVDWGDGSPIETITDHTLAIHDYGTAGTYTISVTGDLLGWSFNNGGDKLKMLDVKQWSALNISAESAFYGCTNLTATATDAPLITNTSLGNLFRDCSNFNGAIGNWDTSSVTIMVGFLFGASSFNQDIGNWNVSNVTNMRDLFQGASIFNKDISNWNTSNVSNMQLMFRNAIAFNQNIGIWNTSSVTNMSQMIQNADAFDQDISNWDINQVSNFVNFMVAATGLSTTNYDLLLVGWEAQAPLTGKSINFGGSKYTLGSAAATARASLISTYGWTITDGGGI